MSAVGTGESVSTRAPAGTIPTRGGARSRLQRAIVGATLANDVDLRDFEGRLALLLGKAKDENASGAIGPFLRFFDETFMLDDVRKATISLRGRRRGRLRLDGGSSMAEISGDPSDIAAQTIGASHAHPDGLVFFSMMFAPVADRALRARVS